MSQDLSAIKVAIVCDWLTGIGGAEQVVLEFHKLFPSAPIYTSQYNPHKIDWFKTADVRTSWLQKIPTSFKKFLPVLRAVSFSRLDLSAYDLVLSSSGAEAKSIKTGPNTIHISYIHSPTHYYWMRYSEYLKNPGFGAFNWLARLGLRLLVGPMKKWDYRAAQRPDYIITNSTFSQSNIKKFYKRDSTVIHPPVDVKRFRCTSKTSRDGFIIAGRQTPYKRFDLAVLACGELGLNLKVVGDGPDHARLLKLAKPSTEFLTNTSSSDLPKHFQSAKAFLFPGIDDFGIVAVEALAAGTPVIGYGEGGILDYITKDNGILFSPQTRQALVNALKKFNENNFSNEVVANSANGFSGEEFRRKIIAFIKESL